MSGLNVKCFTASTSLVCHVALESALKRRSEGDKLPLLCGLREPALAGLKEATPTQIRRKSLCRDCEEAVRLVATDLRAQERLDAIAKVSANG